MKCRRCGETFEGNYCPVCGEAVKKEAAPLKPASNDYVSSKQTRVTEKRSLYQSSGFTAATLFLCFPLGLFLMWKYRKFNNAARTVITGLCSICMVLLILSIQSLAIHGTPLFYKGVQDIVGNDGTPGVLDILKTGETGKARADNTADETESAPDIEKYSSIVKQELSRFLTDLTYSKSSDDWNISENGSVITIQTRVRDSSGETKAVTVKILYETGQKYYEPLRIEYDGELLFDGEILFDGETLFDKELLFQEPV